MFCIMALDRKIQCERPSLSSDLSILEELGTRELNEIDNVTTSEYSS